MKNIITKMVLVSLVVLFGSCATLSQEEIDVRDRRLQPGEQVIGTVQTTITAGALSTSMANYDNAYKALLEIAKRQYGDNVDIRDIEVDYSNIPVAVVVTLPAKGKVIRR